MQHESTLGPITAEVIPGGTGHRTRLVRVTCPVTNIDGTPVASKTMNCRLIQPPAQELRQEFLTMNIKDGVARGELALSTVAPAGRWWVWCSKTGAETVAAWLDVPKA
jgi:hypothetical protein